MSETILFPGNISVRGMGIFAQIALPAGCIGNSEISPAAGITTDKLEHRHRKTYTQSGAAASVTIPIHLVIGATARNLKVRAGSIAKAVGDSTVTIDVKKNGTSVLSGGTPLTLNSGNSDRTAVDLTVTTFTAAAGNLYELVIVATVGTGTLPTGLFVEFELDEVA